jgi:hypothetical protein
LITVKFIGIADSGNDTGTPVSGFGEGAVVQGWQAKYLVKGQLVVVVESSNLGSISRLDENESE